MIICTIKIKALPNKDINEELFILLDSLVNNNEIKDYMAEYEWVGGE